MTPMEPLFLRKNITDLATLADLQAVGCRERRWRLSRKLDELNVDGIIFTRQQNLTYFFGLSGWKSLPAAGFLRRDGFSVAAIGRSAGSAVSADETIRFEDSPFCTNPDDRERLSLAVLLDAYQRDIKNLRADTANLAGIAIVPVAAEISSMRRIKDADEVALIAAAIAANEAGYLAVAPNIRPGVLEMEVFAMFHAAATVASGETIGELGNDFRGGQPGGRPRPVPLVAGDLLPVDAGATVANYYSDMCRTFAVSGKRAAVQEKAFEYVVEALSAAEKLIQPGVRCGDVFAEIASFLNTRQRGWRFDHHLGHGIGLDPVEGPFINAGSDDVFVDGCTFTLEPGLYGDDLRAGVRLEQNYVIEHGKLRRLSSLPLDIQV